VAAAGDEIRGGDGSVLRLITTGAESGGELLEMEASYPGTGWLPPEHYHPRQDERFTVLEGTIRAIVDGVEASYGPGESFDVPAGTRHQMGAEVPSRTRWEIRPALRTAEFFERLHGDGPDSAREADSPQEFLAEFSEEIRFTETG
jgi:hypothetical protein